MSHPNRTLEDCQRVLPMLGESSRIGIVVKAFGGINDYEVGEYVIFKHNMAGHITVETPMSEDYYSDGHCGLLRTYCCICCVPPEYVMSLDGEVHICPYCRHYKREGMPCWIYDYCGCPVKFKNNTCEDFDIV